MAAPIAAFIPKIMAMFKGAGAAKGGAAAGGGGGGMMGKVGGMMGGSGGKEGGGGMLSGLKGAKGGPGNLIGTAIGAGQFLSGLSKINQADKMMPAQADPRQISLLNEIDQKRRALDVGSEYAAGSREIGQGLAGTQDRLAQVTGGDVGGTMAGLLKAQRGAGTATNNMLAQGQQNQRFFTTAGENLLSRIAQRKMDLQLMDRAQKLTEGMEAKKVGGANFMAGLSKLIPASPMGGGGVPQTQQSAPQIAGTPSPAPGVSTLLPDKKQLAGDDPEILPDNVG